MRDYASHNSPNDSPIIVNAWDETVIPSNQSITLRALPNSIEYVPILATDLRWSVDDI